MNSFTNHQNYKWKALCWDDKPQDFDNLKKQFHDKGKVNLEITSEADDFFYQFDKHSWNFLILDTAFFR